MDGEEIYVIKAILSDYDLDISSQPNVHFQVDYILGCETRKLGQAYNRKGEV